MTAESTFSRLDACWWDPNANVRKEERALIYAKQEFVVQRLLADNNVGKEPQTALDIACGRGRFSAMLKEMNHNFFAVDISREMLEIARKQTSTNDNVDRFIQAGVLDLPFRSNSLEIVTAIDISMHVPEIGKFLKEIHRVLKPGGILAIDFTNKNSIYAKIRSRVPTGYPRLHYSPDEAKDMLDSNGFQILAHEGVGTVSPLSLKPNWEFVIVNGKSARTMSDILDPMIGKKMGIHQIFLCTK